MGRIRTIKPEFWTDLKIGECSPSARLLFVGLWNFADDHGGIERPAKQLKAKILPYDDIDAEALVQELLKAGLVIEYDVSGNKYLHIKNFRKHQKIDRPSSPRVPLYEESHDITESSPRTRRRLAKKGSGSGIRDQGKKALSSLTSSDSETHNSEITTGAPEKIPASVVQLHESLPKEEWEEWLNLRRKRRWPVDSTTLKAQLRVLAEQTMEAQREMIRRSINAGWQGIFPPRQHEANGNGLTPAKIRENLQRMIERGRNASVSNGSDEGQGGVGVGTAAGQLRGSPQPQVPDAGWDTPQRVGNGAWNSDTEPD